MLNTGGTNAVYGAERLLGVSGGTRTWYASDALSSVRRTVSDTGTPQGIVNYDPWGQVQTGSVSTWGFTGELQQGTNVYLRARWYNSQRGIFTVRDSWSGDPESPQTLHPYSYVANHPTNATDASGLREDVGTVRRVTTWADFRQRYPYYTFTSNETNWEAFGFTPDLAAEFATSFGWYAHNPRRFITTFPPGTYAYSAAKWFSEVFLGRWFDTPADEIAAQELSQLAECAQNRPFTEKEWDTYVAAIMTLGFANWTPPNSPDTGGGSGGGGGSGQSGSSLPKGFKNFKDFEEFGEELYNGLKQAGYDDVEAFMQGSSVTGRSAETGKAFDDGRISDFDVAVVSDTAFVKALDAGMDNLYKHVPERIGPIKVGSKEAKALGVDSTLIKLRQRYGRDVDIAIYSSSKGVYESPSHRIPPYNR